MKRKPKPRITMLRVLLSAMAPLPNFHVTFILPNVLTHPGCGSVESCASARLPGSLMGFHGAQRRCDEGWSSAATLPCHPRDAWQLVTLIRNFFFFFTHFLFLDSSSSRCRSFFFMETFPGRFTLLPSRGNREKRAGRWTGRTRAALLLHCSH